MLKKLFFGLFAALFFFPNFAYAYSPIPKYYIVPNVLFDSSTAACSDVRSRSQAVNPGFTVTIFSQTVSSCTLQLVPIAGGSTNTQTFPITTVLNCNGNDILQNGLCVPNPDTDPPPVSCVAGQARSTSYFLCHVPTSMNPDDTGTEHCDSFSGFPTALCDAGCVIGSLTVTNVTRSQTDGLWSPVFVDADGNTTGDSCDGTGDVPNPPTPTPPPTTPPPGVDPGNCTDPAGCSPDGPGDGTNPDGTDPGDGTNPNPTDPGDGTNPNPVNPVPTDPPAPCGAPGQPICAVKVDEAGTPAASTGTSAFNSANTEIASNKTATQSAIDSIVNQNPLPSWSWSFQLPTGCSPLPLQGYGFSLDVCEFKPIIHDLMSLLWVAAGIFGLLGLARSAFEG